MNTSKSADSLQCGGKGADTGDREEPVFLCRDIEKCYEGEAVVSGVSLELPRGGIISLLGPSGVGKTTLFNVLAGVDSPGKGRIFLEGKDITGVSGKVSYMMQKDLLLEHMTVLDNTALPLFIRGMKKKEAREACASFFERFGLTGCEKKYPRLLSGGMRQRAALLRTCMMKNPVVLLDEPFSALDALTRRAMQRWFEEILKTMGLSALFITHDVDEALILSRRVYVMTGKPGKITAAFSVPHPGGTNFFLSPECTEIKRRILGAIDSI